MQFLPEAAIGPKPGQHAPADTAQALPMTLLRADGAMPARPDFASLLLPPEAEQTKQPPPAEAQAKAETPERVEEAPEGPEETPLTEPAQTNRLAPEGAEGPASLARAVPVQEPDPAAMARQDASPDIPRAERPPQAESAAAPDQADPAALRPPPQDTPRPDHPHLPSEAKARTESSPARHALPLYATPVPLRPIDLKAHKPPALPPGPNGQRADFQPAGTTLADHPTPPAAPERDGGPRPGQLQAAPNPPHEVTSDRADAKTPAAPPAVPIAKGVSPKHPSMAPISEPAANMQPIGEGAAASQTPSAPDAPPPKPHHGTPQPAAAALSVAAPHSAVARQSVQTQDTAPKRGNGHDAQPNLHAPATAHPVHPMMTTANAPPMPLRHPTPARPAGQNQSIAAPHVALTAHSTVEPYPALTRSAPSSRDPLSQPRIDAYRLFLNTGKPPISALNPPSPLHDNTLSVGPAPLLPAEPLTTFLWEPDRPMTAPAILRPELGPPVMRQLVDMLQTAAQKPVEIALSPQELGRVRLSVVTEDRSVTVQIIAERPETIDLMRRHIDQLGASFRQMGFETIAFAFGKGAEGRADGGDPKRLPPKQTPPDSAPQPIAEIALSAGSDSGLDLRL